MELHDALLLFPAAMLAGALNAVAGGGTFFVFPALIFTGVPPVAANATSTMAVWPGTLSSIFAYRGEIHVHRDKMPLLAATSAIGGCLGASLLLFTSPRTFEFLIPYLLLTATLLFTFGGKLSAYLRAHPASMALPPSLRKAGGAAGQLLIAIYGGYFGAGIGILMLALLSLMGLKNIHEMNALKTVLGGFINGIAVVMFILAGAVYWPQALLMMVGAVIGGYAGAHYAKKLPTVWVRRFVIFAASAMTLYFFVWK